MTGNNNGQCVTRKGLRSKNAPQGQMTVGVSV